MMKNLANCTPREFLVQTNKIRKIVADWLDVTKVLEIRRTQPIFDEKDSVEEKKAKVQAQVKQNLNKMLDTALEDNIGLTLEVLGALCFVEPEDVDNHPMREYIGAIDEIIGCPEVLSFFTSLMQLGRKVG